VVVEAPGMGDEVQAIKAGVLEIGDLFVVNKAERPGAERTVTALEMMLHLDGGSRAVRHHGQLMAVDLPEPGEKKPGGKEAEGWAPPVLKTTASTGEGVDALHQALEAHRSWLHQSGELARRERIRLAHMVEKLVYAELNRRLRHAIPQAQMAALLEQVNQRRLDPFAAAERILEEWEIGGTSPTA
jgi:LAO/AO transport system kinase